jgi:hypothetical protein
VALATALTVGVVVGSADGAPAATAAASQASAQDLGAALSRFPLFAAVPDSSGLTAPVLTHGRLTDTSGTPMNTAQVLVSAWPSNATVHNLPIGSQIPLTPIARTMTSPDGSYQIRASLTPLLRSLTDRDGLDVEFDVFHAGRQYVYLSQVAPTATGTWVGQLIDEATKGLAPTGANPANLLDIAFDPASGEQLTSDLLRVPTSGRQPDFHHPAAPWCTNYEKAGVKDTWETIATAVARPGVTTHVRYDSDARTESSTGVAIDEGAFSVSGGRSRTAGIEVGFHDHHADPGETQNREYFVHMNHNVFRRACATDYRGHERVLWVTDPDGTAAKGSEDGVRDRDSRYQPWQCSVDDFRARPAEAEWIGTHDGRAATYSRSFSFAPNPWATFTGNSLSGYNKDVKVQFHFDDWQRGYWCGSTDSPAANDQRVQGFEQ